MIKTIVTNKHQLAMPSVKVIDLEPALEIVADLLETARHYQQKPIGCVGLAANQIGRLSRIIVFWHESRWNVMINPVISYATQSKTGLSHESCLSRPGVRRKIKREKRIFVEFTDDIGNQLRKRYSGFTARIIQHEVDHLDGIFI